MNKNNFYTSKEWRELRYIALITYGRKCACCNSTENRLHVDHIKPRSIYPHLELDLNNLQVLCADCNIGKSNKFFDDFRNKEGNLDIDLNLDPVYIYNSENTKKAAHLWYKEKVLCRSKARIKNVKISKSLGHKNRKVCRVCANIFNNFNAPRIPDSSQSNK